MHAARLQTVAAALGIVRIHHRQVALHSDAEFSVDIREPDMVPRMGVNLPDEVRAEFLGDITQAVHRLVRQANLQWRGLQAGAAERDDVRDVHLEVMLDPKPHRQALVSRHNPVLAHLDVEAPLSVGNGEFAFTVDTTGLQTFAEAYDSTIPLGTLSQWGWHTAPNPNRWRIETFAFKPFDSISDDDRDMSYMMFQLGAGYQLTNDLYASLSYEYYHAKLEDGTTAFAAYRAHEMAAGTHDKNLVILRAKLPIGGADVGFEYQYDFGTFKPDFGTGYVVQYATADQANNVHVPVGSPGFSNTPWGDWNSLLTRDFTHTRLKAYMKVQF